MLNPWCYYSCTTNVYWIKLTKIAQGDNECCHYNFPVRILIFKESRWILTSTEKTSSRLIIVDSGVTAVPTLWELFMYISSLCECSIFKAWYVDTSCLLLEVFLFFFCFLEGFCPSDWAFLCRNWASYRKKDIDLIIWDTFSLAPLWKKQASLESFSL